MRNLLLLVASLFFYFWGEQGLVWILFLSITCDYFAAILIDDGRRKLGLFLSLAVNFSLLAYFKYVGFAAVNVGSFLEWIGYPIENGLWFQKVALPLGISFYTFQSLSYTIDVYRGKVKVNRNIVDFATYVTLFPQLIAGPIVRYSEVAGALNDRRENLTQFADGLERFVIGLGKKVILANYFAAIADKAYSMPDDELSIPFAWMGAFAFTLQILFDFEGYSDMAIGLGKMFGFEFPENFNFPYASRSLQEFWQRWHMTLYRWLRDYLYVPLAQTNWGRRNRTLVMLVVFVSVGIWHGANWTFVLFGLLQGGVIAIEQRVIKAKMIQGPNWLSHVYLIWIVVMSTSLFRSESLLHARNYFMVMYGHGKLEWTMVRAALNQELLLVMIVAVGLIFPFTKIRTRVGSLKRIPYFNLALDGFYYLLLIVVLVISASYMTGTTYDPFLYFRF